MAQKPKGEAAKKGGDRAVQEIHWNDANMRSTYANVCNVSSTREEVTLLFGTNQTWTTNQKELTVELTDRIILNPYAAKRMSQLLNKVMAEYENRFGELGARSADETRVN